MLIMAGLSVDATNKASQTPLMLALKDHPTPDAAIILLDAGASVTQLSAQNLTALHYAASNHHVLPHVFNKIIDAGAKVDITGADQQGATPLILVASSPAMQEHMILTLLDKGAKASDVDLFDQSVIHSICANRNITEGIIRAVVQRGVKTDPFKFCNTKDGYGLTPLLHLASNESATEMMVDLLLVKGAEISAKDKEGRSALHRVLAWPTKPINLGIVNLLLEKGLSTSEKDKSGHTPLQILLSSENVTEEQIKQFTAKGGSLTEDGQHALHVYCRNQKMKPDVIKYLIGEGCDVTGMDSKGYSVLHHACANPACTQEILKILYDKGAGGAASSVRSSPLQLAIQASKVSSEVIKFLLENGSEIPTACDTEDHPLYAYLADEKAEVNMDITKLLLDKSGDISGLVDNAGMGLLHLAAKHRNLSPDVLPLLLEKGADVKSSDRAERTPLSYLCENPKVSLTALDVLISKGADVQHVDGAGMQPIHLLSANLSATPELLEALFKSGAEVGAKDSEGKTAAHYICDNEKACTLPVLSLLETKKANWSQQDDDRNTPLHNLVRNQNCTEEMVVLLMERGFDAAGVTNRHKQTPIDIAEELGLKDIKKEIIKRGANVPASDNADPDKDDEEVKKEEDAADQEKDEYDVKLLKYEASDRIAIIKKLMEFSPSLTTKAASKLVDEPPVVLSTEKADVAKEWKEKLEELGATIILL
eukprot:NODE_56_length_3036_cov_39.295949_g44_i0.p1 GENE.NODE_56_length_3036_cov_39.295949_g44_i0~~NODE_56_length_3036_cov_39.295949_g44_i0.p1  ORF type:complete len:709 (+),score=269.32 NODE_56_length_3036_cov_39.295949_g44_i0:844-2970(+)